MEWQFIVALIIAVPVILFPAVFMWYVNIGGLVRIIKSVRGTKSAVTIVTYKQTPA